MSQGILELTGQRITYVNPKASEILKLNKENLLGTDIARSLPLSLYDAIKTKPAEKTSTAIPIQFAGLHVVVEQFSILQNPQNRIILLSDITEEKKMEAVIEAANLTKNLGYVFSGIRHEIGNPLNSIKMALSVLQRNLQEYDKETIAEFLDRSLHEVTRLEYLLKALKNYSLFERPDMQVVSVSGFIADFIALIRNDFEGQYIKIQTIINENDLTIWADSRALHHIMLNLVTNAVDALEGIEKPQISISASGNGAWVDIKIDDNGKGISERDQQHLFQPFFTSKTAGTGLGLVIVKKMLAAMNGKIFLESYPAIGTTVTVTLARQENVSAVYG
jgi:signal transduction histidine kinase